MSDGSRRAPARQQLPDHERVGVSQLYPRIRAMINILLAPPVGTARKAQGESRQLRAALAVLLQTAGWGKTTDLTTIGVLSERAQMPYTPTLAGVHALAARGAITYRPGSRGKLSRTTLPVATVTPSANPNFGTRIAWDANGEAFHALVGGILDRKDVTAGQLRLTLWLVGQLTTWMRPDVRFSRTVAAAQMGLSPRCLSEALAALTTAGLIQYQPGMGRTVLSVVALPGYVLPAPRRTPIAKPPVAPGRVGGSADLPDAAPHRKKVAPKDSGRLHQTMGKVAPYQGSTLKLTTSSTEIRLF